MVSANPRLCVQILKFMFFMQAIWFLCPAHQNGLGSTAEDRHDSSTRQQTAEETTDDSNEKHHLGGGPGGGSNFERGPPKFAKL